MDLTLRPATQEDAGALAAVHVEGWQWGYRDQLPRSLLDAIDLGARLALWRRVTAGEEPGAVVWLAERDQAILGFVALGPPREKDAPAGAGEIRALYLVESVAGTGVGRALLGAGLDALRARGATVALLWVLDSNARARRFYERAGFTPDGAVRHAPWQGVELRELRYRRAWEPVAQGP